MSSFMLFSICASYCTLSSRNGHSSKTLRTSFGDVEISVPRDRKGEFELQVLKKSQTSISQDIEEKILSMYAKGMTTSDIETHIQEIYGVEVSDTTVSRITDKILPIAKEWQQRPLESVYAVVFMDAIHYHVRSEGQIVKKAVYIAIGIDLDGRKDVLGMWVGENESAKYWATVLNSLKNRGIEDIFIACTDNLTGFSTAIEAVFPKTEIQNCIIHQLRNSSKYVSYRDIKALMADLKAVYAAVDEAAALDALDAFSERWDKKYPKSASSWRENWSNLSTYFKYPQEVRRLIYTTNAIEGFNRQLRKVTKSKSVFPTDDSLLKMLYLAMMDITKKWTGRRQDWSIIHAQLAVFFADRMPDWPAATGMSRAEADASALDIPSKRCYFCRKGDSSLRRSRLKIILLYFAPQFSVYTKFGIDPTDLSFAVLSAVKF